MIDPIQLLIVAAMTYGLSQTIAWRDGPFDILLRFRIWVGVYNKEFYTSPDPAADAFLRAKGHAGRLFGCPYCIGVWVALGLALWLWNDSVGQFILGWWATVGIQAFAQRLTD